MSKKIYLSISIITVLVLGLVLILRLEKSKGSESIKHTAISTPTATPLDLTALATIHAERNAIAIFTQNPTLALSSTPFYAQILYNEVERNLTEVPFPKRPCYLNPTNVPQNSTTPIKECGPFIATMMLGDEPRKIMALMGKLGIQGTVGIVSDGLEGINNSDNQSFVAARSRVGILIDVTMIPDQQSINDTMNQLTDILIQNWEQLKYVSNNADISIVISNDNQNRELRTTYAILYEAYKKGLKGQALIQAMGGFSETN